MKKNKGLTLHHFGVVVQNLQEATELFKRLFDIEKVSYEILEERGLEIALLNLGDVLLELISPIRGGTSVERFLKERGGGLHHVSFLTEDFDGTMKRIAELGIRIVDGPRKGAFSDRVVFLHPKDTNKVLVEIMEMKE